LVELLVVITIIGILIALLLPAVQAAREAAKRMQCGNNLKQMALGALTHESTHGWFPTGGWNGWYIGDPDLGFDEKQCGGWIYNVLPYIEQQVFHDQGMGLSASAKKAVWVKAVKEPIATLFCPSRREPGAYPMGPYSTGTDYFAAGGNLYRPTPAILARNDYAVNGGSTTMWAAERNGVYNGVGFYKSHVRMAEITDGTSNTYLIGEKYVTPDYYKDGNDGGDNQCAYGGFDQDNCRWTWFDSATPKGDPSNGSYRPRPDTSGWVASPEPFGSSHAGGLNMAFCDGSVRIISYEIDPEIHSYLGNREDGAAIDAANY
jgi:prepilin-type processing-associated H-X9-DG protein